jgi:hypothetical protein
MRPGVETDKPDDRPGQFHADLIVSGFVLQGGEKAKGN